MLNFSIKTEICFVFFLVVVLFLLCFRLDGAPAGYDIDPSWSAVMSWGWSNGSRWGSDLVFSYGPFSFLSPHTSFANEIFGIAICGQLLYSASFTILSAFALQSTRMVVRVILLLWLLIYGAWLAGDVCWLLGYPLALLALRNIVYIRRSSAFLIAVFIGFVVAVPCVVKFSSALVWPLWATCVLVQRIPMRLRLASVGASVMTVLVLWLGSGNTVTDLLRYIETGLEIATGYGAAMQRPPKHWSDDVFGLALLALTLLAIVGNASMQVVGRLENAAWIMLLSTVAILAFKAGYTRIDTIHLMIFLPVACGLAILAAEWPGYGGNWVSVLAPAGIFLFSIVAIWSSEDIRELEKLDVITGFGTLDRLISNADSIVRVSELQRSKLAEQHELEAVLGMPRTRNRIAEETVDIMPVGQGLIFRNGMNYKPRPAFQSYFSYTPKLVNINIASWRSEDAPTWVLLKLSAIDQRLPSSEDGASLLELLSRYRLDSEENGVLVFHRVTPQLPSIQEQVSQGRGKSQGFFGQVIPVPESARGATTIAVTVQPTAAGRLAALVLREPRIFLSVMSIEGEARTFRLVRGSAEIPFLISPLLTNNTELAQWLAGGHANLASSVTLLAENAFGMPAFDSFTVSWGEFQPIR